MVREKTAKGARGRRVLLVACDGVTMFEFGVALEFFSPRWAAELGVAWYELVVAGPGGPVRAEGEIELAVPRTFAEVTAPDTVVVPPLADPLAVPRAVIDAVQDAYASGARVLSLCTGAFVLAAAGLLDGRRATTHWSECAELATRFPAVDVDPNVLYVDEGRVLTSAGSAASIDLCLHVVRLDYGAAIANRVARELVVAPHRAGGQAQYIESPVAASPQPDLFASTLTWIEGHLDEGVSVEEMAAHAAMSPRSFARRFVASMGTTPHQWLLRQRVQLAQRLLETSELSVETVAQRSGFGSGANLRTQFKKGLHVSPQAYRETFRRD